MSSSPTPLRIDFVSDVSCPWCAIGLSSLNLALDRLKDRTQVDLHFQPFELNPQMPKGGQEIGEHLTQKYGSSIEQQTAIRETIRQRGAEVGFEFRMQGRDRIYNTFDAHRLLHWAEQKGKPGQQLALKLALLKAYFTHGKSPEQHEVLIEAAEQAGFSARAAQEVLSGNAYTDDVRAQQKMYLDAGIHSVPAIILNQQYLVSGGQPVEVFEQAILQALQASGEGDSAA